MSTEPEIQDLLQQTAIWNAKADYSNTIKQLNAGMLSQLGSAELYMQAGQAKFNTNDAAGALADFEKAIELKPGYAMAYYNRGTVYYYSNEPEKALSDYNTALQLDPGLVLAYLNRGNTWYNYGQADKAFDDYSSAIRIDPSAALAYYGRGNVWFGRNEFLKAIPDYNQAIHYSPDFMLAYNNRGLSWLNLRNYEKALKDFDEALRLEPNSALVFNNKGLLWVNEEKYDEAISQFDKAIQFDPTQALSYFNRGLAWFKKQDNKQAIKDLSKAIELAPFYAPAWYRRGMVWEQVEKNTVFQKAIEDYQKAISLDAGFGYLQPKIDELLLANAGKETPDQSSPAQENIFSKILAGISSAAELKDVSELAAGFLSCINKIKDHTRIKTKCAVAHYTKLWVADKMFLDEKPSYLHYSNVAFMNDPEEGKVLKDVLLGKNPDQKLQEYFRGSELFTPLDLTDANVYLGSFLPASAEQEVAAQIASHEDELVMWRTYGKDENNNEAAGCSIIIGSDFFGWPQGNAKHELLQPLGGDIVNSQQTGSSQFSAQPTSTARRQDQRSDANTPEPASTETVTDPTRTHVLYRVLYYRATGSIETRSDIEQETNDKTHSLNGDIDNLRNAFLALLQKAAASQEAKAIDRIISVGLSELRYFFKSANYSFENEYRVIKYHDSGDPAVMIEDRKTLPKPLYIQSEKPLKPYVKKIYLGPKVQHPERWNYLEVALKRNGGNKDVRVLPSTCKFQ